MGPVAAREATGDPSSDAAVWRSPAGWARIARRDVNRMSTKEVSADAFTRFAAGDLVRWRALTGRRLTARDARWGEGRVADVRWEGRADRPDDDGVVYVRAEYAVGLRVRVNAMAFGRLHKLVDLDAELAEFVERRFADAAAPDASAEIELGIWDARLREAQDTARQQRIAESRRRAASS